MMALAIIGWLLVAYAACRLALPRVVCASCGRVVRHGMPPTLRTGTCERCWWLRRAPGGDR